MYLYSFWKHLQIGRRSSGCQIRAVITTTECGQGRLRVRRRGNLRMIPREESFAQYAATPGLRGQGRGVSQVDRAPRGYLHPRLNPRLHADQTQSRGGGPPHLLGVQSGSSRHADQAPQHRGQGHERYLKKKAKKLLS